MIRLTKLGFIVVACLCGTLTQAQKVLTFGDPAPAMKAAAWLKGNPVTSFQPGTIYIVDFWATWCGPCARSMPHMSEIARKFIGKVVVIGVDVEERPRPGLNLDKLVSTFVQHKGDKMDYAVCMDDASTNLMAKSWLYAANLGGLPTVFIVDQKGRLADMFTGYSPGDHGVDDEISQLIAGTFDPKASVGVKQRTDGEAMEKEIAPVFKVFDRIEAQRKLKCWSRVVEMVDDAMSKDPKLETAWLPYTRYYLTLARFGALAHANPDHAYVLALKERGTERHPFVARAFAESDGLEKRFYVYSIQFYEGQYAAKPDDLPYALPGLYLRTGQPGKAAEFQKKLIDALRRLMPDTDLYPMEADLKKYLQAAVKHS